MRKILCFILMLLCAGGFSQNRKGTWAITSSAVHTMYVCFSGQFKFDGPADAIQFAAMVPEIEALRQRHGFVLKRGIDIPEDKLLEMEANAEKLTGSDRSVKRLRNIFKVEMDNPDNEKLLALAKQLESLDSVVYCSLVSPDPVKPPGDILPVTQSFEISQAYLNANPGVNMRYAWNLGLAGAGIKVRDVEYGVNQAHEEFNERPGNFIASGMNVSTAVPVDLTEHGTATFGVVFADKGSYGISGMAHDAAEMILFPEWQQSGYNRIYAVSQSIASSTVGDIIIFEMQADVGSAGIQLVPAEYNNIVWDLTKAATDAGITIVAAAGNGNQNLDSEFYAPYMNRGNSGAIIVGAGTSNIIHAKMNFSTYGSRLDVQAWGNNVVTSGYGDWMSIGSDFNQNYTRFSGTSSATPIVASCAIVLQSYYHALTGNYLTPLQLRDILVDTGIPQGPGGHIGPIPNMQQAVDAVSVLAVKKFEALEFAVFPNPATDKVSIIAKDLSPLAKLQIINSVGQSVCHIEVPADRTIDVSHLPAGLYFVKLSDNAGHSTKKLLRN